MDYREMMMQYAPNDCKPTVVDNEKDYKAALEKIAAEKHKKVEDLTEEDKRGVDSMLGLCALDFLD